MNTSEKHENQEIINKAFQLMEITKDIGETISKIKQMYDDISNDNLLLAKRRLEMMLFRLMVLKYYTVEERIGQVDRILYCQQAEEGSAYRANVIRSFDQTFDRQQATEFLKVAIDYMNEENMEAAFSYFMKATLEGSTLSAFQCGKMMMTGEGCIKDEF